MVILSQGIFLESFLLLWLSYATFGLLLPCYYGAPGIIIPISLIIEIFIVLVDMMLYSVIKYQLQIQFSN